MKKTILVFLFLHFSFFTLSAQSWLWGKEGKYYSNTYSVAADRKGNAYLQGWTKGIHFGALSFLTSNVTGFLLKVDTAGNFVWLWNAVPASSRSDANGQFVATDTAGNIFYCGEFFDTVSFGAYTLSFTPWVQTGNVFVCKIDNAGNVLWAKQSNAAYRSLIIVGRLQTDIPGNVYVPGYFNGALYFGSDTLTDHMYSYSSFVVKYDKYGTQKWVKQSKASTDYGDAYASAVCTDNESNVYLMGLFNDTISFGSDTLRSHYYGGDLFLVKYDSNGNVLWAKQSITSSSSTAVGYSIITDAAQNIYVIGGVNDTASFGPYTVKSGVQGAQSCMFLTKYDPNGNVIWAKQSHSQDTGWCGFSLSRDKHDNIYLSGAVQERAHKLVFGGDTLLGNNALRAGVVMKLDTSGKVLCGEIVPGCGGLAAITNDPAGKYIYLGGNLTDTVTLGYDFLYDSSGWDAPFIARWEPTCKPPINEGTVNFEHKNLSVKIYPNPNRGVFNLSIRNEELGVKNQVEIYNMLGEKVYDATFRQAQGDYEINLSIQPNGVYLYRIITETGQPVSSGKFIIEK